MVSRRHHFQGGLKPVRALVNLLADLPDLDAACLSDRITAASAKAREAWALAFCCGAGRESLCRYFSYHAALLATIQQQSADPGNVLSKLVNHLLCYFPAYVDHELAISKAYIRFKKAELQPCFGGLLARIEKSGLNIILKNCLLNYLNLMFCNSSIPHFTVGSLFYLQHFMVETGEILNQSYSLEIDNLIEDKLIALNFNSLEFFIYLQERFRQRVSGLAVPEKLEVFRRSVSGLQPLTERDRFGLDPLWPPVAVMLKGWFREEVAVMERELSPKPSAIPVSAGIKINLNLSVAYLACLIKVFYEAGLYGNLNLSDIFKFTAQHFSTKRQLVLSPGSLSNEYYGVSQKTAAMVRAMLQDMISGLDRGFFQ